LRKVPGCVSEGMCNGGERGEECGKAEWRGPSWRDCPFLSGVFIAMSVISQTKNSSKQDLFSLFAVIYLSSENYES